MAEDKVKKIKGLTEAKIKAIERAWNDDAGFGSIRDTVKEAKKYDPSVTADDFKEWKAKQDVGQKAKMRGMNSFIADKPKEEKVTASQLYKEVVGAAAGSRGARGTGRVSGRGFINCVSTARSSW